MKLRNLIIVLAASVLLSGFSCGQNGPTTHSTTLNFTQSTSTGITANCWYKGTAAGVCSLPGTCSTVPVTTFTDTNVVEGQTVHYAVTAKAGNSEIAYSNDVSATTPANPRTPTGLGVIIAFLKRPFARWPEIARSRSVDGMLTAEAR
jgi:hypothetical protein